jgi:hypothetical protein
VGPVMLAFRAERVVSRSILREVLLMAHRSEWF